MKSVKAFLLISGFFIIAIVSVPLAPGQTPTSRPIPVKVDSEKERYPAPKEGLVPDKETAIKIAEVVLVRLYGEGIKSQRPYVVKEDDYIWWITGTLPKDSFGIEFKIGISRHTAAVLYLTVG